MATTTFALGSELKYEATDQVRYNGVDGVIWVKRIKCRDGSGWMHDGKLFMPSRATRKDIVEAFGQVFRASEVKAA